MATRNEDEIRTEMNTLSAEATLAALTPDAALRHLGTLIDHATTLRDLAASERAIALGATVDASAWPSAQRVDFFYFLSNAWANVRQLRPTTKEEHWTWDRPEVFQELLNLRRAAAEDAFSSAPKSRRADVFTNLGNALSTTGRFVEALEYWERAMPLNPESGMGIGNRGYGRSRYAWMLDDPGHMELFLRLAHMDLKEALTLKLYAEARDAFVRVKEKIEKQFKPGSLQQVVDFGEFPLGATEEEIAYRRWCLREGLFLNPMNDLTTESVAAHDILTTPSIVTPIDEGPRYQGFYNQMKQEFVSARFLLFEAITAKTAHYSDRDVLLFDTYDYATYGLAAEKLKMAFRVFYSLLDKTGFFVNTYFQLGIDEGAVNFRTLWYEKGKKTPRAEFRERQNWPLRGLYWLSRDLVNDDADAHAALEPDARAFAEIRNHLEHRYLKLHSEVRQQTRLARGPLNDDLAYSLYRGDLERRTRRLAKLVRAAIIYLTFAVKVEERERAAKRPPGRIMPAELGRVRDDWKR
jgi:tetratricopeptide (TPR) repeat protein